MLFLQCQDLYIEGTILSRAQDADGAKMVQSIAGGSRGAQAKQRAQHWPACQAAKPPTGREFAQCSVQHSTSAGPSEAYPSALCTVCHPCLNYRLDPVSLSLSLPVVFSSVFVVILFTV